MSNSTNVETNVVQMRFNNKNFEKNVSQTMDSLDKLKKELKFDDSAKSFKSLEENAKKVDFTPLSKGIEKVRASFSFLDTFSATVYHRLSNRLIDLGKKVVSSVSTDGIKSGFSEYELKMNSFKTIKASAGKDFTDSKINEYLEELNKYADKTIYSFSDMTNNIGKFTNAGVKLDVAVKAIKGISNEAAVSGANAEQASHAMYNFSQALSAGYVKLTDWKSIEISNMATEEFKNELIKTAVSVGKLTKAQNGMYKTQKGKLLNSTLGFNEALQDGWMTTEVLTKTLGKYADETTDIGKKAFDAAQKVNTFSKLIDTLKESIQSGWSRVWELVVGDLERATALWTSISDAVGKFIDKRFGPLIKMLEDWNKQHGRADALKAIGDILKAIGELLKPIGRAFRDIFPKKTVNDLLEMTGALEDFAKKVKPTSEQAKKLQDTFRGIFAAISIVLNVIKAFKATFGKFFIRVLGDALHTIFGVTGSLGDMLVQVRKSVIENKTFYKAFQSIVDVLEWVYSGIKKVAGVIWDLAKAVGGLIKDNGGFAAIKNWFSGLFDAIKNFSITGIASHIASMFKNLWKVIDGVLAKTFDFYTPMKNKLIEFKNKLVNSKFAQWIVGFYQKIVDGVQKVFNSFREVKTDGVDELNEKTKSKFSIFEKIAGFFKKVWSVIKKVAETIWPLIKGVFNSLKTGIQMLWTGVTENIKNSDLGDAGGLLAGAGIMGLLLGIKNFIKSMTPMFKAITSIGNGFGGAMKSLFNVLENASKLIKAKILKEIAISILMLTASIFVLCTLPKDKIVAATAAIGVLFQGMTSVFKAIDGLSSDIDENGDPKAAAKKETSGAGRLAGAAAMILSLAIAMAVLTIAMKKISSLSTEDITKGMIALGILFKMIESTINGMLEMGQRTRGSKSGDINIAVSGVASMIKALGKAMIYIMAAVAILALVMKKAGVKYAIGAIVLITFVLTVVGRIMKEIMKYTKQSESWATAISGFATMFAIGFIIKEFAAALIIIVGAIAILGFLISKNIIDGQALGMAMTLMLGAISMILLTLIATIKIAKAMHAGEDKAGVLKVAALFGVIVLFINALSILFTVLSLIPNDWAMSGVMALGTVSSAIVLILLAISKLLKNSFFDTGNQFGPKGIAIVIGTITAAIVALVIAITAMSKSLGGTGSTKAIWIIVGIAAAISAIILALGHFQKFAKGFEVFTKGFAAFGIAAAGFAAAAALIILTLKQISKMSDSEIAAIGKNMKKVTTAILTASDQIIGLIMGLVHTVVGTAIGTAVTTIINSSEQIIAGLIELLDILLINAPTIVNKLLQIAVEILSTFERECAPVIAQIVSTVATIISEVAKAITDNAPKIVDAINDVITAITTVVVGSVAKMLGLDEFKGAVNTLIKIIKPFTAALLAMFAINKFKKNADTITKVLKFLKGRIVAFKDGFKKAGFANGWKEMLGINQLNDQWKKLDNAVNTHAYSTGQIIKGRLATIAGALTVGAGIGLALGSIVKSFIDAKTEALDATSIWYEETHKEFVKMQEDAKNAKKVVSNLRSDTKKDIKKGNIAYDTAEMLLDKLRKDLNSDGSIKKGKEKEVQNIAQQLNSDLGVRLELENDILKIIDEQGNKRKADLGYLQKIIDTERAKATLDKEKEKIDKYQSGDETDESSIAYWQKQKKTNEHYKKSVEKDQESLSELLEEVEKYKDQFYSDKETLYSGTELGAKVSEWFEKKGIKGNYKTDIKKAINFDEYNGTYYFNWDAIEELQTEMKDYEGSVNGQIKKAQKELDRMNSEIKRYDAAYKAYLSGNTEALKRYTLAITHDVDLTGTAESKKKRLNDLITKLKEMMADPESQAAGAIEQQLKAVFTQFEASGLKLTDLTGGTKQGKWTGKYDERGFKIHANGGPETFSDLFDSLADEVSKLPDYIEKDTGAKEGLDETKEYISQGIVPSGLSPKAKNILGKYTNEVVDETRKDMGIKSPSQLMHDKVGIYAGEGVITGLEDSINSYDPTGMASTLVTKLRTSILPAIASLTGNSSLFGGITPVNFGMNQNGSYYSGASNTPATSFASPLLYQPQLDAINANLNRILEATYVHTDTMVNEMHALRGDVGDLASHIDDLELRLDSDAIVGGLTPKLNNSLLKYSRRVERGL